MSVGSDRTRRFIFILLVIVQIGLLVNIVIYRVRWLRSGYKVLLDVTPVDPMSLMRGEYVRLGYKISELELGDIKGDKDFKRGEPVYVTLAPGPDGVFNATGVWKAMPDKLPFIKGRAGYMSDTSLWAVTVRDEHGRELALEKRAMHYEEDDLLRDLKPGKRLFLCSRGSTLVDYNTDLNAKAETGRCSSSMAYGNEFPAVIINAVSRPGKQLSVDFTIDSYYVQQGMGKQIERKRDEGAVRVEAALRDDGMPLISALMVDGERLE